MSKNQIIYGVSVPQERFNESTIHQQMLDQAKKDFGKRYNREVNDSDIGVIVSEHTLKEDLVTYEFEFISEE